MLEDELRRSPEMQAVLLEAAREVQGYAERFATGAHAPWMPARGNRGRTIEVQHEGDSVYVVNTDHAGHLYEFGSKNGPAFAPLRRAVRAAGLTLTETPKP